MSYRTALSRGGRTGGQSAAAKHAYHVRQGEYAVGREGVRDDLTATGCGNLPAFAQGDPAAFWLAADSYERANAALFIDLQLNLPHELTPAQQQEALRGYCDRMFDQLRLPYSWAIHGEDHVHLMVSERMTDDIDRPADKHFRRCDKARPERGGAQKTRELQSKTWLLQARGAWAEEVNRVLVANGFEPRFDHRSLQVRRDEALERGEWRRAAELNTLVEQHEGPRVAGMRRRLEGGLVDLEDLPEYAQLVIVGNDTIRAENAAYLARVARMSDDELRLMQADDIQRLARERLSGAERIELAELEGQQQDEHASQLEALASSREAAELGALVSAEALDIVQQRLALEHEQAHAAALIEDAQRAEDAALDGLLHGLHALCDALDELRERDPAAEPAVRAALDAADRLLALPPPSPVLRARLDDLERDYGRMLADERRRRAEALRRADEQARAQREAEARQHAEQERQAALERQQRELARLAVEQAEAQRQQVIEHARSEYRGADRRVLEALAALRSAQSTLAYQQQRLADAPALQKQRNALAVQANEHAATVERLRAERSQWLADHPILRRAGLTGPADALRQQEANHLDAYHQLFAQAEQISSRIRSAQPAVDQAQRAVDAAQAALREAEAGADRRFDDAGGPDAALRRAGLAQPAPLRERFAEGLQRMEQRLDDDGPAIKPPKGPRI